MTNPAILTLALTLTAALASAAPHRVLFEKFTNVGCAPCAIFAPQADSLIDSRLGEVIEIVYHGNYPYPNDEFYLPVREQVTSRIDFYGVKGFPTVELDGVEAACRIPDIDTRLAWHLAEESRADISLSASVADGILHAEAIVTTSFTTSNPDIRLFVAVVEQDVTPERPAFNGQTIFHNEFRQFLTPTNGEPLRLTDGVMLWENNWTIERFEDVGELALVAWLQDVNTGKVYETGWLPRAAKSAVDARIIRIEDIPEEVCAPLFSGKLWLRNMGADTLTDCDIYLDIDGVEKSFSWRGYLPYLATECVEIPPFTDFEFQTDSRNSIVSVTPVNMNGVEKEGTGKSVTLRRSLSAKKGVELLISTDNKPQEISWHLEDGAGNVICESEPYTERRHDYRTTLPITTDGCYTLMFHDMGGDGITGQFGAGYYRLYETDGETRREIVQGDYTGTEHKRLFYLEDAKKLETETVSSSEGLYFDRVNTIFHFPDGGSLSVYSSDGRRVIHTSSGNSVSLKHLPEGIYAAVCTLGGVSSSMTVRR